MRKKIYEQEETIWLIKIASLLVFICLVSYLNSTQIPNQRCAIWGDTWECKSCGYESYEGISRCPICGTAKGSR